MLACGLAIASVTLAPSTAAQVVIDRIVAVVNGSVMTLSDVQAAMRFGLVTPDTPGDTRGAIERLIDRRLALAEVERYAPAEPPVDRLDAAMAAARGRFASDAAFAAALAETGLTTEQLRRHFRDDLRRQAYEQQRFGFALHPSEEETVAYYRAHPDRFRRDGVVPPYDAVQADVRAAVIADKRAELVREWIAGLRRRADVTIVPDLQHPQHPQHPAAPCSTPQHPAAPCSTLQHPAAPCSTLQHPAAPCSTRSTLQHPAAPCSTLQHPITY